MLAAYFRKQESCPTVSRGTPKANMKPEVGSMLEEHGPNEGFLSRQTTRAFWKGNAMAIFVCHRGLVFGLRGSQRRSRRLGVSLRQPGPGGWVLSGGLQTFKNGTDKDQPSGYPSSPGFYGLIF